MLIDSKSNDVFHCLEHVCHLTDASRGEVPWFSNNAQAITTKKGEIATGCSACNTPETLTKFSRCCVEDPVLGFLGVMELILRERDLAVTKSIRLANHSQGAQSGTVSLSP